MNEKLAADFIKYLSDSEKKELAKQLLSDVRKSKLDGQVQTDETYFRESQKDDSQTGEGYQTSKFVF